MLVAGYTHYRRTWKFTSSFEHMQKRCLDPVFSQRCLVVSQTLQSCLTNLLPRDRWLPPACGVQPLNTNNTRNEWLSRQRAHQLFPSGLICLFYSLPSEYCAMGITSVPYVYTKIRLDIISLKKATTFNVQVFNAWMVKNSGSWKHFWLQF